MPVGPVQGGMAAWRSVSMHAALGRGPPSPSLAVPVSQPTVASPAMKLRRNSVAGSDVGWGTQTMVVHEHAPLGMSTQCCVVWRLSVALHTYWVNTYTALCTPLYAGDWLQGQFQLRHEHPDMVANPCLNPTPSGSHYDTSANSTVETNTPLAPADLHEGGHDAWSPFAQASVRSAWR